MGWFLNIFSECSVSCGHRKMTSIIMLIILVQVIASTTSKYTSDIEATTAVEIGPNDFINVSMHSICDRDYCFELPEDYPHKLIAELIEKENRVMIDATFNRNQITDHSTVKLCKVNRTNKPLYQIRDDDNVVRFVAQSEKYEQIIRTEECFYPGEIVEPNVAIDLRMLKSNSYKAVCAEFYYNHKFLVLSLDGQRLEVVRIGNKGIPVCCQCEIQEVE